MNTQYAGFWIRTVAQLLDFIILFLPLFLLLYYLSDGALFDLQALSQLMQTLYDPKVASELSMHQHLPVVIDSRYELILELLLFITVLIFWNKMRGATPGKKICHIYIVDANTYEEISNAQAIIRYVGYLASSLLLGLGFVMAAFRDDKRALHDLMAGTVVIYTDA